MTASRRRNPVGEWLRSVAWPSGQAVARGLVLACGLALVGFGVSGFLGEPYLNGQRFHVLVWGAGAIVLHDGVWMPIVLLAVALLVRAVPGRVRGPLVVGLITMVTLTAIGLPAVLRENQHKGNATLLPLPYLRNWLLLMAGVGCATALGVGAAWWRGRGRGRVRGRG
ncbi:hypothetical protein [Streptacidiphilus cavernicola]|uniref:Uncharacterized protein n=1 Tax=Streptacidiphilus cavernicola TaxID=3342716 RepID=A0ABV6VXR3_9ACTN